jgi:hypothetical protein
LGFGIWDLGFGIWDFLIRLTLLRLRLLVGDVFHRTGMRVLEPLTPERVIDERIRSGRILPLDVAAPAVEAPRGDALRE